MDIDSGVLYRTLQKTLLWTSDDATREGMHGIYVDNEDSCTKLVATSGHGLLIIRLEGKIDGDSFRVERKVADRMLRELKPFNQKTSTRPATWRGALLRVSGEDIAVPRADKNGFPAWREVLPRPGASCPKKGLPGASCPKKGLSAAYLGTIAKVFHGAVCVEIGANLEPAVFTGRTADELEAKLLIAPMRI
jgi:hypothetical protein